MTLLAEAGQDAQVASLARLYEHDGPRQLGARKFALPQRARLPPVGSDRTDLVVCAAHMSGLPLAHALKNAWGTVCVARQNGT